MNDHHASTHCLQFASLFHAGRGFFFPCNSRGEVDLNRLTDQARNNYLFARAMVGRELAFPVIEVARRGMAPLPARSDFGLHR